MEYCNSISNKKISDNSNNTFVNNDKSLYTSSINIVKALFLLMIGIAQDSVTGCNVKQLLQESMIARHIMVFMAIYFGIDLTSDVSEHPGTTLLKSIILWVIFIMFIRTSLIFTITLFSILATLLIIQSFKSYYEKKNEEGDYSKEVMFYEKAFLTLILSFGAILVLGFILYFIKQYNDHYDNFSLGIFIFGNIKCAYEK